MISEATATFNSRTEKLKLKFHFRFGVRGGGC
jgi:hypothetical protein